eukprot:gene7206-7420_t
MAERIVAILDDPNASMADVVAAVKQATTDLEQQTEVLAALGLVAPGNLAGHADTTGVCRESGWPAALAQSWPQEWLGYDNMLRMATGTDTQGMIGAAQTQCVNDLTAKSKGVKDTPELDSRLQRLYDRNIDWRRRCEMVYERQRAQLAANTLDGCTFAPVINQRSERIVQKLGNKYPMRPVVPQPPLAEPQSPPPGVRHRQQQQQQCQRPASTGRIGLHSRTLKERQELGVPLSPKQAAYLRAAAAASQVLDHEEGAKLMQQMLGEDLLAMAMEDMNNSIKVRSKSPDKVPAGIQKLYDDARLKQGRMAETVKVTKEAELKARSRSAPRSLAVQYREVGPRLLNHFDAAKSPSSAEKHAHKPTGQR